MNVSRNPYSCGRAAVAALLDSDAAGEQAANQDALVHTLGNKAILRTNDAYNGAVKRPEVEDMLRSTLISLANSQLEWDVTAAAMAQLARPIVDIFEAEVPGFSKYRLARPSFVGRANIKQETCRVTNGCSGRS
jgi:hypothetical protein